VTITLFLIIHPPRSVDRPHAGTNHMTPQSLLTVTHAASRFLLVRKTCFHIAQTYRKYPSHLILTTFLNMASKKSSVYRYLRTGWSDALLQTPNDQFLDHGSKQTQAEKSDPVDAVTDKEKLEIRCFQQSTWHTMTTGAQLVHDGRDTDQIRLLTHSSDRSKKLFNKGHCWNVETIPVWAKNPHSFNDLVQLVRDYASYRFGIRFLITLVFQNLLAIHGDTGGRIRMTLTTTRRAIVVLTKACSKGLFVRHFDPEERRCALRTISSMTNNRNNVN
jgi:hypothetical protein